PAAGVVHLGEEQVHAAGVRRGSGAGDFHWGASTVRVRPGAFRCRLNYSSLPGAARGATGQTVDPARRKKATLANVTGPLPARPAGAQSRLPAWKTAAERGSGGA